MSGVSKQDVIVLGSSMYGTWKIQVFDFQHTEQSTKQRNSTVNYCEVVEAAVLSYEVRVPETRRICW